MQAAFVLQRAVPVPVATGTGTPAWPFSQQGQSGTYKRHQCRAPLRLCVENNLHDSSLAINVSWLWFSLAGLNGRRLAGHILFPGMD